MLTDDAVRAELERIDKQEGNVSHFSSLGGLWFDIGFALLKSPKRHKPKMEPLIVADALRFLATSQQALREVAANKHRDDCQPDYGGCECAQKIASNAVSYGSVRKGGSNG